MSAGAGSAPPFQHPSPGVELGSRVKKGMEGTAHAYEGKTEKVTPVDVGRPAKTQRTGTSLKRAAAAPLRSTSAPVSEKDKLEAAKRSVEFTALMAELDYEFEDAEFIRSAFMEEIEELDEPEAPPSSLKRRHSAPERIETLNLNGRNVFISYDGRRILLKDKKTRKKYEFSIDKYLKYISDQLQVEEGNASELLQNMDRKAEVDPDRYTKYVKAFEQLIANREKGERVRDLFRTLGETRSQTEERHRKEEEAQKEARVKRRALIERLTAEYVAGKEAEKAKETARKAREKEAQRERAREVVRSATAKIKASERATGRVYAAPVPPTAPPKPDEYSPSLNMTITRKAGRRSSIYTLRAKRRNVRNKEKRRTRKGLVRQGSRPHRKTRRRA
jgi:hypothetical protein